MRLRQTALDSYAADLAALLERSGVLMEPVPVRGIRQPDGLRRLRLRAVLPGPGDERPASLDVREDFAELDGAWVERTAYAYELTDRLRSFRVAYHLHDAEWFEDRRLVVVHEHCERPIGVAACAHYEGSPLRDGFEGIAALMAAWIGDRPDCSTRRCLED